MLKYVGNIVDSFDSLIKILSKMPVKADSYEKRNECLSELSDLRANYGKVSGEINYDREHLPYIKNVVSGIFDGLKDKPIQKKVLEESIEEVLTHLVRFRGEWDVIYNDLKAEEKEEPVVKKPKTKFTGEWKEALSELKDKVEDEETVEASSPTERPDAETINEEDWEQDSDRLKEFQKGKAKLLKVTEKDCIKAPIIVSSTLPRMFLDKLEENNYKVGKIFNLYTLIEDLTMVGMTEEYADKFDSTYLLVKEVEGIATKKFKRKMHIASNELKIKDHVYFIVLPDTIPGSFAIHDWAFQK